MHLRHPLLLLLALAPLACFETAPARCLPDAAGRLNLDFECAPGLEGELKGWDLLAPDATLAPAGDPDGDGAVALLQSDADGWHSAGQVVDAAELVGRVVRLSGRVHVEGEDARAGLALYLEGEQDTVFFLASSQDSPPAGEWRELRTLAMPYDARADHLRLVLWLEGAGQAWFDDVVLAPSGRDALEDFEPCERAYDCDTQTQRCSLGRCLPRDTLVGELAAPDAAVREQALDSVWGYADRRAPGFVARPELDWDEAYQRYDEVIAGAESLAEWGGALTRMIAELRDGHGSLQLDNVACSSMRTMIFTDSTDLACTTRTLDGRIAVYRAIEDNPLGLVAGDEILGYDGRDWQALEAEINASWDRMNLCGTTAADQTAWDWQLASSFLYNRYYFHETIEVKHADGSVESLMLDGAQQGAGQIVCLDRPASSMESERVAGYEMWRQGPVVSKLIEDDRIIYATVRWMDTNTADTTDLLLTRHDNTAGLIWDVRYNRGGILAAGQPIWQALLDHGQRVYGADMATRNPLGSGERDDLIINGTDWMEGLGSRHYRGKIAVLTGPRAISAGDALPWMLSLLPGDKVRRFGIATHGSFSGYSSGTDSIPVEAGEFSGMFSYLLPDFIMLDHDDGSVLTGTDQRPEVEVWLTPEGLAEGRDEVLEAAVAWILEE